VASPRAERREVAESRERILDAAESYFAEEGIDASLHRLAELAGVGNATLFRRFPNRDQLVRALYDRSVTRVDELFALIERNENPGWDRLYAFAFGSVELMFALPVLPAVMRRMAEIDPDYRPGDRWSAPLRSDLALAQSEGIVRADATTYDLVAIPLALGGMAHLADPMRHILGMRLVTIALDGLRAPGATPLETISFTLAAYHRGVHGLPPEAEPEADADAEEEPEAEPEV